MITTNAVPAEKTEKRFLAMVSTYKSFIIGLSLVFAATYFLELARSDGGMVDGHQLMNAFMGWFFIVFAIPKFFNLAGFVDTFRQYDSISKKFPQYARAYPYIELALGLTLLSNLLGESTVGSRLINSLVAIVAGVTLVGVVRSRGQKKQLDCACMGAAFKFPLSYVAVIENSAMFLMACSMLATTSSAHMMIPITHFWMMR